jgi:hypothetical protein
LTFRFADLAGNLDVIQLHSARGTTACWRRWSRPLGFAREPCQ